MDDSMDFDYSDWSEDEDVAPTKKARISPIQPPSPPWPLPDSLPDTMALRVKSTSPAPELSLDNPAPKEYLMPVTWEVPVLSASKQDSSTRALPQSAISQPPEGADTSVTRPVEESVDSAPQRDGIMQLTKAVHVATSSTDDLASTTSTKRKPVATASKMRCPARGCKKRGTDEELACHWQNAHESQFVMWLCPMHRCNQRFRVRYSCPSIFTSATRYLDRWGAGWITYPPWQIWQTTTPSSSQASPDPPMRWNQLCRREPWGISWRRQYRVKWRPSWTKKYQ